MRKKLKIAHIHVWDKKNKGDVAIVVAIQDLLKQYLGSIQIVDFPVEFLREAKSLEIKKLNSCDLVVVGGGGIYYRYFMPYSVEIIKKIKKPIVIFGVGYIREVGARALTKTEKESIVFLNKKAELCSVRDNYSKEFLVSGGVDKKKIKVIGDPAVFFTGKENKKN
ncbi:MAG: polysaccharide pyruvyl transferase family protein [Candidatus Falkowbacteria bacterium]